MFHSGTFLRTKTQETASQTSLRSCFNKVMEEAGYIGVFVKKQKSKQTYIVEHQKITAAAAAAKSLQSCPTLCNPIDSSPPGSPVLTTNHKKSRHLSFSAFNVCVLVSQSCLILCNRMDCSLPGSSVHGILQTRILEWVVMPSSRVWKLYTYIIIIYYPHWWIRHRGTERLRNFLKAGWTWDRLDSKSEILTIITSF